MFPNLLHLGQSDSGHATERGRSYSKFTYLYVFKMFRTRHECGEIYSGVKNLALFFGIPEVFLLPGFCRVITK